MQYAVTSEEMRRCDENTQSHFNLDGRVLMERAALGTVKHIENWIHKRGLIGTPRVLVICGHGKNGGDGYAIGRLLRQRGCNVVCLQPEHGRSNDYMTDMQMKSANMYGCTFDTFSNVRENNRELVWDIIVDAMFGIGCNRPLDGEYARCTEMISAWKARRGEKLLVCSIDMPSGINADDGQVQGVAVKADITVTFNFVKRGQLLYPGCQYTGKIFVEDAGITPEGFLGEMPETFYYDETAQELLPERDPFGNKGTFGKVLVIAGSSNISGACTMSATACLRSGAGMVRVFTANENREVLKNKLQEALIDSYDSKYTEENQMMVLEQLSDAMDWSTTACIGPGIGTGELAKSLVKHMLATYSHSLIVDADALNLIAEDRELQELASAYEKPGKWLIMTPHMGEFSRLYGAPVEECKAHVLEYTKNLANRFQCTVLAKDARSVAASARERRLYLNVSGNSGMATAGSGDVLTGLMSAIVAAGLSGFQTACVGSYLHGLAGDAAAKKFGTYSMIAGDILACLADVLPKE